MTLFIKYLIRIIASRTANELFIGVFLQTLPQYQKAPPCQGGDEWLFGAFGTGFQTIP